MIVRAPRPDGNFYILDKRISEDPRLSWAARGLLIFLLGKPDNWRVSPAALVNEVAGTAKPTGRDGTYALLNELIEAGYVERRQERRDSGVVGPANYYVREQPLPPLPDTAEPRPADPTQTRIEGNQEQKITKNETNIARAPAHDDLSFDFETCKFIGLTAEQIDRWRDAFPATDVDGQLLRAACWLVANPDSRGGNLDRFLSNWLARAQDRAPPVHTQGQRRASARDRTARRTAELLGLAAHGADFIEAEAGTVREVTPIDTKLRSRV